MGSGHVSIMPAEIMEYLCHAAPGTVVDGTAGGGGHAALLHDLFPGHAVLAFERDPDTAENLVKRFRETGIHVFNESYTAIPQVIWEKELPRATAVLFDLGAQFHPA